MIFNYSIGVPHLHLQSNLKPEIGADQHFYGELKFPFLVSYNLTPRNLCPICWTIIGALPLPDY